MSAHGKRSLMQVEPTRLVELAGWSERVLDAMRHEWADAVDELGQACAGLGDATGTADLAASYADALADADEVLASLAGALELGVAGLVDAARDALRADDAVAVELERRLHVQVEGLSRTAPGPGGR